MRRLAAAVLLVVVGLAGCVPPPRAVPRLPPRPPRRFAVRGWLAVRTRGGRGGLLHMSWRVRGEDNVLLVTASLGTAGFLLTGRPGAWCVRTTRRGPRRLRRLRPFLRRWIGSGVPLAAARDWLFGRPTPGSPSYVRFDRHGRVRLLRQDGWSVRYRRFTRLAGRTLPDRLRLAHDGLTLRILIDRWTFGGRSRIRRHPGLPPACRALRERPAADSGG